jgi:hypothetical protein
MVVYRRITDFDRTYLFLQTVRLVKKLLVPIFQSRSVYLNSARRNRQVPQSDEKAEKLTPRAGGVQK